MFAVVAEISLRVVAAAAAVGLVLTVLRVRSGAARHAAWSAVMLVMLTMPVLTAIVPRIEVPVPSTLAIDRGTIAALDGRSAEWNATPDSRAPIGPTARDPVPGSPGSVVIARSNDSVGSDFMSGRVTSALTPLLLSIYVAGVLFLFIRLAGGWYLARRLVDRATRVDLENRTPVFESTAVATPLTTGIVSPSIVLPPAWREWPAGKLQAVLAHENAHIARRDSVISVLAHVNRAVFWFHPVAWWLERTLAVCAEHACDETAAREVGEPRRYAEVLLDMADAVRARGRRVAWPGIGVDGSGLLGTRIDRVLRGEVLARMSVARRIAIATTCAAVLVLAIACAQQVTAPPLRPDPELAKRLAAEPERTTRFEASRDMTPEEADVLEARIAGNPDDWDARERLVTYYRMGRAVPWEKKVPGLRRHALWLIEHHPEHDVHAPPLSPEYDPEGFAAAVRLWEAHLSKPDVSPFVVFRAAQFFAPYDKPRAEQLILRGMSMDPQSEALQARRPQNVAGYTWPSQLAPLYGAALLGSTDFSTRRFDPERASSPYAQEVRHQLDRSTDAALLARVGSYLTQARSGTGPVPEMQALGKRYLERALELNPELHFARTSLVGIRLGERHRRLYEARTQGKAVDDADRLAYEAEQAEYGSIGADSTEFYNNDQAAAQAARNQSVKHAQETLRLAAERPQDPAYSSSVATAHFVLAAAAMREGRRDRAVHQLMEAAKVPPSEEISYYPVVGWLKPVNYLLKAGERERAIEFLEAFAKVSVVQRERLLKDAEDIRAGRMPAAYQYMVARQSAPSSTRQ